MAAIDDDLISWNVLSKENPLPVRQPNDSITQTQRDITQKHKDTFCLYIFYITGVKKRNKMKMMFIIISPWYFVQKKKSEKTHKNTNGNNM